ncbi:hypothetical protein [Burkholderia territorii]|uniref:hypothetical protein n=1 Tax=Burkholderia territorii TaxID=1503055 RepID=UPI00075FF9FD|nr:hypothetical protein [Burkholderia territorii]KWE78476.1 hypothetical protein WT54_28870 [Burkholderia territorii]
MAWVDSFGEFVDFISYVLLSAPDDFPVEDYLSDDEQMNLDKAFDELKGGMRFVEQRIHDKDVVARLHGLLDASFVAYRADDSTKGAHLLQDFQRLLLEKNP